MERPPLWVPPKDLSKNSRLANFLAITGKEDVAALNRFAVEDPESFWNEVALDIDFDWTHKPSTIVDLSDGPQFPHFWTGAKVNLSELAVDRHARRTPHKPAVVWESEDGTTASMTYWDLAIAVSKAAVVLRDLGVKEGSAVGIFMPMVQETVVLFLAIARLGAIVCPLFSGYGAAAIETRLRDCDATVLCVADGFRRRGKWVDTKVIATDVATAMPSLKHLLVVRQGGKRRVAMKKGRDVWYQDAMAQVVEGTEGVLTNANDPFMLIYTSGTTGRPKGTVHSHAGFPFKAAQDMAHCFDVRASDRLLWYTDLGWMMGPWAICGTLIHGATLVLFDGVPDYPDNDRLWEVCARHGVTVLGVAPTVVRSLMRHGEDMVRRHDLSQLRILGSSGEPWNPDPWTWFLYVVGGGRCPIINYSGGTEISGGILGGNLLTPLAPCSFAGPIPGMDAAVFNDKGESVVGEVGELVVRAPWPGMTHSFWKDKERYLETYWSRWPNIWVHGDWAEVDADDGLWYIRGRSDDTIKVAGKRVGPAEVESELITHPAVSEAAAIGIPDPISGEVLAVFLVLAKGVSDSPELRKEITALIGQRLGKALRPHAVEVVSALPKTRNAKVVRRVVRSAYLGRDVGDITSLENPDCIDELMALAK